MWLSNDYIKLRALEPEDLDLLYSWENQSEFWDSTSTIQPYSRFALKEYISQIAANIYETGQLRLMIVEKENGQTVGTIDLYDFDIHHSRLAVGLFVAPEYQSKAYGTTSLKLIEDYVFNFLKINQIYCYVAKDNHISLKLFRSADYQETTIKAWIKTDKGFSDVSFFQKIKQDKK